MAIRVEPSGLASAYGGAAMLAGKARAAERSDQLSQEQMRLDYQRQIAQLENQWEVEKFNRSMAWEVEKMEMASRADFAEQERTRQEEHEKIKAKENAIKNAISEGYLSEREGEILKLQIKTGIIIPTETSLYGKPPWWMSQTTPEQMQSYITKQTQPTTLRTGTASAAERTAIADARTSRDILSNLKNLYSTGGFGTKAPITGKLAPIRGLWGGTTQPQEDFMAATSAFKNAIIKQITGAQMSEKEANRIIKQIPDITDPPARWNAKWKQSLLNIQLLERRRMQILEQSGIKAPAEDLAVSQAAEELGF